MPLKRRRCRRAIEVVDCLLTSVTTRLALWSRSILLGGSAALALAACAEKPVAWWHQSHDLQQSKRDNYQCVQASRTAWSGGGSEAVYIMCMEARGYVQATSGEPYLGVRVQSVERGLQVESVVAGGPAESAGLRVNDVVSGVDGRRIATLAELRALVESRNPGDRLNLVVVRDGDDQEIVLTIGRQP
jgi:predicted metalloprotease with PDZ domain